MSDEERPVSRVERRCPSCGALVTPEAEWCGLCFTRLLASDPAPAGVGNRAIRVVEAEAPDGATAKVLMWPCPACGTDNPIETNNCSACGTPFGDLFRQDEAPPKVEPGDAFRRSLVFPGLGHRAMGRGGEGLARAVLFLTCFAIAIVALGSGAGTGAVAAVAVVFGVLGLLVYLGTAFEASQIAGGSPPLLSSRTIVWIVGGVLMAAVFTLTILITFAARSAPTQ